MGNTLKKITPGGGTEGRTTSDITNIIQKSYGKYFEGRAKEITRTEFYRAVCEIVEEMNQERKNTQFRVPTEAVLWKAYEDNHKVKGKRLEQDEFVKILQQVIKDTGFSGGGAKDTLIYIFGVPITALFVKQAVMPDAIKNDYFIPGITSLTVLVLAKLNKI